MTDRLTPMEAEVLEMPAKQRGTSAVKDSYGTATPPKPKKSYLGLWILLGLTVVIMSTFGVITHFLRPGGGHRDLKALFNRLRNYLTHNPSFQILDLRSGDKIRESQIHSMIPPDL